MKLDNHHLVALQGKRIESVSQPGCNVLLFKFTDGTSLNLEVELVNASVGLYGIGGTFEYSDSQNLKNGE